MSAVITFSTDAKAVDYILRRLQADPRLAYLLGPGSEAYRLLTEAQADRNGVDVEALRRDIDAKLEFQTVPAIGAAR